MWKRFVFATSGVSTASALFIVAVTYLLFFASMTMWMVFLWRGSLSPLNKAIHVDGDVAKLGFDCVLSMAFFLQHSGMIRRPFKRFMARSGLIAAEYYGAIYSISSAIVLMLVVTFWQKSTYTAAAPKGMVAPALILFVLAIAGMCWATFVVRAFDPCGVHPILRAIGLKGPPATMPLSFDGPYGYVRHPNYFCCIVLIWSSTDLSLDRLLYNILWTAWVIAGTFLEEQDLKAYFGEPYRDYIGKVPMLFPALGAFMRTREKKRNMD